VTGKNTMFVVEQWRFWVLVQTFSLGSSGGHGFRLGSIQSGQLQVSSYELYYASICFWCL